MLLVDAEGNVDLIEVKRPRGVGLLAAGAYRDNAYAGRELSQTVMQAEKYLFHLQKWGARGEAKLTERYASSIPAGMRLRITHPRAMLVMGRDRDFSEADVDDARRLDLEVAKRTYARVADVTTYDDLLRRLDAVIASLNRRAQEEDDAGAGEVADRAADPVRRSDGTPPSRAAT